MPTDQHGCYAWHQLSMSYHLAVQDQHISAGKLQNGLTAGILHFLISERFQFCQDEHTGWIDTSPRESSLVRQTDTKVRHVCWLRSSNSAVDWRTAMMMTMMKLTDASQLPWPGQTWLLQNAVKVQQLTLIDNDRLQGHVLRALMNDDLSSKTKPNISKDAELYSIKLCTLPVTTQFVLNIWHVVSQRQAYHAVITFERNVIKTPTAVLD